MSFHLPLMVRRLASHWLIVHCLTDEPTHIPTCVNRAGMPASIDRAIRSVAAPMVTPSGEP